MLGPIGGFLVSAVGFFVFEMWFRRRRERRDLTIALSAELELAAGRINTLLVDPDRDEIPAWFLVPIPIYSAVPARLGELPFNSVKHIASLYSHLSSINRMGPIWHQRALAAFSLPPEKQAKEFSELRAAVKDFYGVLAGLEKDCKTLSAVLRHNERSVWQQLRHWDFSTREITVSDY